MAKTLAEGRKAGSGRRSSGKEFLPIRTNIAQPIGGAPFELPNLSGDHSAGTTGTPVNDRDIANKKYVDDSGGAVEGTAVLSTGEGGGTKFLREDGDGTSSWQADNNTTDHTALSNIGTNTHAQIDTHISNEPAAAIATHAALGNAHHNEAHTIASHSDTTATGAELETLTDGSETTLHSHADLGGDVTAAINLTDIKIVQGDGGAKGVKTSNATVTQVITSAVHSASDGTDHANVVTNTTNIATNVTAIGLNTTHRGSDGSEHADVASNTAASHAQAHTIASHSDTTGTGAELNELTDGSETILHSHAGGAGGLWEHPSNGILQPISGSDTISGSALNLTGHFSGSTLSGSSFQQVGASGSGMVVTSADGTMTGGHTIGGGGGGGTPGGSNSEVQFNDGGSFSGSSSFVFSGSAGRVGINTTAADVRAPLHITTESSDLAIRIQEDTGSEFYDIELNSSGDLVFVTDSGGDQFKIMDSATNPRVRFNTSIGEITDTNSYMQIVGDSMDFIVGARKFVSYDESTQDVIVINDDSFDIDIRWESDINQTAFFFEGATGTIGIGTNQNVGASGSLILGNSLTNPTINPTNAYVLFSSGSTLWGRGGSGTITLIGPA